jgi:isopentenyldiphosphate isomerase
MVVSSSMNSLIDMEKLRKQIRESFFNPILHFLPLLIFLVVDEFFGMGLAWEISFPVALILLVYFYYNYNNIFTWHLISTGLFFSVGLISTIGHFFLTSDLVKSLSYEIVAATFFLVYLLFQQRIQQLLLKMISKLIPMTNNFSELNQVIWKLFSLLLIYIFATLLLFYNQLDGSIYQILLKYFYLGFIIFIAAYEILRVYLIRSKLISEEWWPIVNDQGRIIGSIQHLTSLNDQKKYMHPSVRVLIIDKSMILLQKRSEESVVFPGLWDTAITNHVKMGESIEQCVDRTAVESYALSNFKYMYLSNYTIEVEKEHHYAFLFVSCQQTEFRLNENFVDQLKWWTQQQIDEELETGIFSENFKVEYDLLKRSGLLETGKCECSCRLKEVIYQQSINVKKE